MNALPSLVSSVSSSASEDTSSASVEVDSNIRASLTLPGLSNNARSINPQQSNTTRHQSRPRMINQPQGRNINRDNQNNYTSTGHQHSNYPNPNQVNKLSVSSESNLSICYSYMLAAISSIMVVVGIYLSLTRFNLNYLYLSLAGLLLVALGACLYCIGRIQLNRKARRKLRLSDDDLEVIDRRGLAAAAAASHILNTRGLVQVGNNGIDSVNHRNLTNHNLGSSSENGTATSDSLLVMINPNNENGPISILSTSAHKQFIKGQVDHCDSQTTIQQLDQVRPQHISGQLIDADEAFGSNTDSNEVAMSQLSLNMIPQYFSTGISLRPNKLCHSTAPESSSVINLTSGTFGSTDPSKISPDTTEKSLNGGNGALQLGKGEHLPQSSNSDTTTATTSNDQGQIKPTTSCLDRANLDLPNKTMGPLSQSQIVNVNGRQFLILPLNDNKINMDASNHVATESQDSNNNHREPSRSTRNSSEFPRTSYGPSTYTQDTTNELIDKIRTLNIGDSRQLLTNAYAKTGTSINESSKPQPLRRESSFTFNNTRSSHNHEPVRLEHGNKSSSPRGLKHSRSFNEKLHIHESADRSAKKNLLNTPRGNIVTSENQHQESNEPSYSSLATKSIGNQPCSSHFSQSIESQVNSIDKTGCGNANSPIDKLDDISQSRESVNLNVSDSRLQSEDLSPTVSTNYPTQHSQSDNVEPLPSSSNVQQNNQTNSYLSDMQPSTSSGSNEDRNRSKNCNSRSKTCASTSNIHHRTTLIMGLSGEEELIEINDADIDNMSMLPPSYESLMGRSRNS